MHITLSKNLAHLRKKVGFSQAALSGILHINRSTYASYEEYRSEPSLRLIQHISHLFRISIEELFCVDLKSREINDPFFFQL